MCRVLSSALPTTKAPRGTRPRRGGESHRPSTRERARQYSTCVCVCVCVCARARAHARTRAPPRPSGMENRMIPLAPQESLAQIYRLLPDRTPRYKAGQLTSTHRHVSPGYTLSSSISHERVHSSATILPCWCPFLCYFLGPEPDQGSLARPF